MTTSKAHSLIALAFSAASLPVAYYAQSAAGQLGFPDNSWLVSLFVFVGLVSFGLSLWLSAFPMASVVGVSVAALVLSVWALVTSSYFCWTLSSSIGIVAVIASLIGWAVASFIRHVNERAQRSRQ